MKRAIKKNNPNKVAKLLDEYIDVKWAIRENHLSVIEKLAKTHKSALHFDGDFPFRMACQLGQREIVQFMLETLTVDVGARDGLALRVALYNNHMDVAEFLLDECKSSTFPNSKSNRPICLATCHNNVNMVRRLMEFPEVDPSDNKNEAIKIAAENGNLAIAEQLLQDKRVSPYKGLVAAIRCDQRRMIRYLSDHERLTKEQMESAFAKTPERYRRDSEVLDEIEAALKKRKRE